MLRLHGMKPVKLPKTKLLHTGPRAAALTLVLAHGAGAGMRHPFMQQIASGLAERGVHVVRFEFPYMQGRSGTKRTPPNPLPVLLDTYRRVVAAVGGGQQVVIGGKSMGGRIASMIADEVGARGLVCLGYPFHPPEQPDKLRTAHLAGVQTRTLIVQGTRDTFGTREEVAGYTLSKHIELLWIKDGDHDLTPRRKLGHDKQATMQHVLDAVAAFTRACG